MSIKEKTHGRESEGMSDASFKAMQAMFDVVDFFYPYLDKRVKTFGIREGMTVVDYGCGPGRYTVRFARLVGESGRVYAVDIQHLAVEAVKSKMAKQHLQNVIPLLAEGYHSGVPDHAADVVCALDMFHGIQQPTEFLAELKRIVKADGMLIIDEGHQPREETKKSILESGHWAISEETSDHLKCKPQPEV